MAVPGRPPHSDGSESHPYLPLDSLSLREKVAADWMRVKTREERVPPRPKIMKRALPLPNPLPLGEGVAAFAPASWSAVLCTAFSRSFQFFKTLSILSIHVSFFTVPNSAPESGGDSRTPRRSRDNPKPLGQAERSQKIGAPVWNADLK